LARYLDVVLKGLDAVETVGHVTVNVGVIRIVDDELLYFKEHAPHFCGFGITVHSHDSLSIKRRSTENRSASQVTVSVKDSEGARRMVLIGGSVGVEGVLRDALLDVEGAIRVAAG